MVYLRSLAISLLSLLAANAQHHSYDAYLSLPSQLESMPADWAASGSVKIVDGRTLLTSQDAGFQSGSLWTKNKNPHDEWTIEAEVMISGTSQLGGGLAIWYAGVPSEDGPVHGSKDQWDGLAVILDTMGSGDGEGTLRGHLNDGERKYYDSTSPVQDAFALCKIGYRNTQVPFKISIGYYYGELVVAVNGQKCFETDQVVLPSSQYIGISAASTPGEHFADEFAIYSFHTFQEFLPELEAFTTRSKRSDSADKNEGLSSPSSTLTGQLSDTPDLTKALHATLSSHNDRVVKTIEDEVRTMHTQMNDLSSSLKSIDRTLLLQHTTTEKFRSQLDAVEALVKLQGAKLEKVERQLDGLSNRQFERQVSSDVKHLQSLIEQTKANLNDHSNSLLDHISTTIKNSGTSLWMPITIMVIIQLVVFALFRRADNARPKYL